MNVRRIVTILGLVLSACSENDDVPAPLIASVTPSHATPGTTVTIGGSNFCQQPETSDDPLACLHSGEVVFGVTTGTVNLYTDDSITAEVPSAMGSVELVVTSNGRSSNELDFVIDAR